jgi:peptidoglycan/LPS O-acetylase OafA/YrhL
MGMAAGLLFLGGERDRKQAWPLLLTGLAAVAVVVVLSPWIPYLVIHTALLAPAFAVIVYGVALRPAGVEVLENKVMEALGEASYPFYLLHNIVISSIFMDWRTGTNKHQTLLGLATWFLIAVGVALLVDRFIERPLRRLLRPKKKPVEAASLPVSA